MTLFKIMQIKMSVFGLESGYIKLMNHMGIYAPKWQRKCGGSELEVNQLRDF